MKSIEIQRARLRWHARRGLLENDLIITKFLDQYENSLSDQDIESLSLLFDLDDNTLLDILLNRAEPEGKYDTDNIRHLVGLMRQSQ